VLPQGGHSDAQVSSEVTKSGFLVVSFSGEDEDCYFNPLTMMNIVDGEDEYYCEILERFLLERERILVTS